MANAKTLKKTKLRNTEYYDLQSEFDELYAKSQNGKTFKNLMSLISSEENIKLAYRRKFQWYQPQTVRRVEIPKGNGKLLKQIWNLGIRDKKMIKIISVMIKAEVAGIGFPERGTPQGGIISPLLSNIVLNELDWWIASQWEEFPASYNYKYYIHPSGSVNRSHKFRALRRTRLKECFIVRYADDFKIFCRNRQDAEKVFYATKQWLKERLGLEINEEKSKIVNLKKHYSEFLGIRFKVAKTKRGDKVEYFITSYMTDKAKGKVTQNLINLIKMIQHPKNQRETNTLIDRYNSNVIGVHNYYNMATMISKDCRDIAFRINRILENRLRNRIKKTSDLKPTRYIEEHYGESKQLGFVNGRALVPIGYMQYKSPVCKKRIVNKYTPEGREAIHKNLVGIDMSILHYLMRNPVGNQTIEYNDNRLSLYCAQKGKSSEKTTRISLNLTNQQKF